MEIFDIVDSAGKVIGTATREECHNGSFRLHGVVHVLVFDDTDRLILQKRSRTKYIQPDKWDTSIGGHISSGETISKALKREAEEELGIIDADFEKLYSYIMVSDIEKEYVTTFRCFWKGKINFDKDEIEEVRSFSKEEIESLLVTGFFTPNFEEEWIYYKKWLDKN
ncbi:NUDIX domain-containing protein [Candidatus Latescibacterota bacterium]